MARISSSCVRRERHDDQTLLRVARNALAIMPGRVQVAYGAPDEESLGKSKDYPTGTLANW